MPDDPAGTLWKFSENLDKRSSQALQEEGLRSPGGYCLTLSKKSGIMVLRFHSVAGLSCNS